MFASLTETLSHTFKRLTGQGKLTADNIATSLQEVRIALLDADVAVEVINLFIQEVESKAIGLEVNLKLTPAQVFIKVVNDALVHLMGDKNEDLNLRANPPAVILMAGLQGSGKTTTVAKLAKHLKERHKKKVMVASCDIYRPAAIEQLETLAQNLQVSFFPSNPQTLPVNIAKNALQAAKNQAFDILIIDTAGRLHIDELMMQEVKNLHAALNPVETLFVVDSMTGQDAALTARAFNEALNITGVILTKTDGDARGGAALSIRYITGKPIKFLGTGEKVDGLEPFHPERLASRILGMGDMLSLIEEIEHKVDKEKAEKLAKKIQKGKGFDLSDLREQLKQMMNMGGLAALMSKLPGLGNIPQAAKSQINDKQLIKMIAIIDSMTPNERKFPAKLNSSRKKRIAAGSGTQLPMINQVLKQHTQMEKMMKKMSGAGNMMRMMQGLKGRLPPGMFPGG